MTPETRDAIEGLEYALGRAEESQLGYVTVDTAHLRTLLDAVNAPEQPTDPDAEAKRARQHQAAAEIQDLTFELFPDHPYAPRHRPLTDEPSGVIPTQRGLDYLAIRRQQHPKAAP